MVWSVAEKRLLHECTWSGGKGGVNALAMMPDDQRFLSGGHDRTVRVWLVKKQAMTFNDEGAKVALGNGEFKDIGEDGSHKYYCGRRLPIPGTDGRCGPTGGPQCRSCIRFQERKELGDKKTVVHSELELMMGEVKVRHAGAVNALVALPDNKHALSASADKTIKLFSVPNVGDYWSDDPAIGTVLRTFKHHCWSTSRWNAVKCLALLPDGLRFVSGSYDGTACIVYHGLAPQ